MGYFLLFGLEVVFEMITSKLNYIKIQIHLSTILDTVVIGFI